jgi:DNA-binding beta-propeller fold protein YncE
MMQAVTGYSNNSIVRGLVGVALTLAAGVAQAQTPAATATRVQTIDVRTWTGTPVPLAAFPQPPQPPGVSLSSIAFDPTLNTIYVSDYATTNVYLVDAGTGTVTSAVYTNGFAPITADFGATQNLPGTAPTTVLANLVTSRWLFMTQGGGAQLLDTTLGDPVSARAFFSGGAWDPVSNNLYATDGVEFYASNQLKILFAGFACAGGSNAVAVNPITSRVYVSCGNRQRGGGIVVYDGRSR